MQIFIEYMFINAVMFGGLYLICKITEQVAVHIINDVVLDAEKQEQDNTQ